MEEQLNVLIQRYQATKDPIDAVAFAEAYSQSRENVPIGIWIVDIFTGSDNGSDINLYLTERDALLEGSQWVLEYLEQDIAREEQREREVDENTTYQARLVRADRPEARNLFERIHRILDNNPNFEISELRAVIDEFNDRYLPRGENFNVYKYTI